MRLGREHLARLEAAAASAAGSWRGGRLVEALGALRDAAADSALHSPGTGVISPQAATLLGQALGRELTAPGAPHDQVFAACAALARERRTGLFMLAPHVLTPLARKEPASAVAAFDLAASADPDTAAALVIPLLEAARSDPEGLAAAVRERRAAGWPRKCESLLEILLGSLADRDPAQARALRAALRPEAGPLH